jgi:hypothetical protein
VSNLALSAACRKNQFRIIRNTSFSLLSWRGNSALDFRKWVRSDGKLVVEMGVNAMEMVDTTGAGSTFILVPVRPSLRPSSMIISMARISGRVSLQAARSRQRPAPISADFPRRQRPFDDRSAMNRCSAEISF